VASAEARREELKAVWEQAQGCMKCPQLASTRTKVVFGAGNADADLMFVGEAPGANEDKLGLPFVGQAGKLLDKLLGEIGMTRQDVFVANTLKCVRYDAPVQLGDGSWERIGRLVRTGYAGTVMSVDADGNLVPRRVTGWHASPLGDRRVYRLTYRNAKWAGEGKVSIKLTGDHPVLTERGYVPAAALRDDDRVATGQGLSGLAFDVVCGSLLGDATISSRSSHVSFAHTWKQYDYAVFKADLLRELGPVVDEQFVAAVAGGSASYEVVQVRTRAHRALRLLSADFYAPRKIVPAWMADALNPRMLAFWFMDDGYCRLRGGGRKPLAEIATNGFSDDDRQILLRALQRLGLPAKASRGRIYFDVATTRKLCELIAPYVTPSMRYKLDPEVEARIPFVCPDDFGPRRVMYDTVEVEDVTDRMGADKTFFCIDVEETHNFVTAGGVVHNCRPPGNRDPLPGEIDACQDYLFRQLELIEPRVVCTLGNFATKLLRNDAATGITRLHGREEIRRLGPRTVRLYPLYHPAAALYTPSMLEILRTDFQRIPELLALPVPEQPEPVEAELVVPEPEVAAVPEPEPESPPEPELHPAQLGLF
jgi:uracil-DNA glycosylase family 4